MSSSQVLSFEEAVEQIDAALDALTSMDLDTADGDVLLDRLRSFETVSRRADAVATSVAGAVDRRRAFALDGHMNARACVRHNTGVSTGEAAGRVRSARALLDLPAVAAAYDNGELSTCHVRLFAAVWSNPRVRELLPLSEDPLLAYARVSSHSDFTDVIRQWERIADIDGAHNANEAAHRRRDTRLEQNFDTTWRHEGNYNAAMGAAISEVFEHFVKLELEVDWDKARAEHGDNACADHLPRTAAQRRADAMFHMAQRAAAATPGMASADAGLNLVMDLKTFEEYLARLAGETVQPDLTDFTERRCSTTTGHTIHPHDAVLAALYGKVRRVVIGADSAVIDLGRYSRFFTRSARDAALLANPVCTHPGCEIPAALCEADHIIEWSRDGPSNATTNGNPRCGFHNKLKNHGYRTWREPDGTWHSTRPDGTPIT